jgi:hypothetical protein
MYTLSSQRSFFHPTRFKRPTSRNPQAACSPIDAGSAPPITATIVLNP